MRLTQFWEKVKRDTKDECWLWLAGKNHCGYGNVALFNDGEWTWRKAHRIAWELTYGKIPSQLFVLHKCDNPPCCNPNHLFLGTQADNMMDMDRKGRRNNPLFPAGENHPNAKLTQEQVNQIRKRLSFGERVQDIAEQFNVAACTISNIKSRRKWKEA